MDASNYRHQPWKFHHSHHNTQAYFYPKLHLGDKRFERVCVKQWVPCWSHTEVFLPLHLGDKCFESECVKQRVPCWSHTLLFLPLHLGDKHFGSVCVKQQVPCWSHTEVFLPLHLSEREKRKKTNCFESVMRKIVLKTSR